MMSDLKYWLRQGLNYYIFKNLEQDLFLDAQDFSNRENKLLDRPSFTIINLSNHSIKSNMKMTILSDGKGYEQDLQKACRKLLLKQYSKRLLEQEWARYKYWMMSKNQAAYNHYRLAFRNIDSISVEKFYEDIDALETVSGTIATHTNALQHLWGYFKNKVAPKELEEWLKCLEDYQTGKGTLDRCHTIIRDLLKKYPNEYVKYSYYIKRNID